MAMIDIGLREPVAGPPASYEQGDGHESVDDWQRGWNGNVPVHGM